MLWTYALNVQHFCELVEASMKVVAKLHEVFDVKNVGKVDLQAKIASVHICSEAPSTLGFDGNHCFIVRAAPDKHATELTVVSMCSSVALCLCMLPAVDGGIEHIDGQCMRGEPANNRQTECCLARHGFPFPVCCEFVSHNLEVALHFNIDSCTAMRCSHVADMDAGLFSTEGLP